MSYPYMSDSGTGSLNMFLDGLHFVASCGQSDECPGHLQINARNAQCRIDNLNIQFESSMSFIYNALVPLLTDALIEKFNTDMSQTVVEQLIGFANDKLRTIVPATGQYKNGILRMDGRWIGGITMKDRSFEVHASGAACLMDIPTSHCAGKQPQSEPKRCPFMLNTDITYEISKNVFNGLLSYLWDLNQTFLEGLGVSYINISVSRVAKSGIVVDIYYEKDGQKNAIRCISGVRTRIVPWVDSLESAIAFSLRLDLVVDAGSAPKDEAEAFIGRLNSVLEYYAPAALMTYSMETENAMVVFCDENWVFVGVQVAV